MPHAHHSEQSLDEHDAAHESAESLADYLELIFHSDMQDGHLENFESSSSLDLEISSTAVSLPLAVLVQSHDFIFSLEISHSASEFYLKDDPYPDSWLLAFFGLRGPPYIS